ncbi:hypothetical protein BCO23253_06604 [Burkholderia contaminans]|nr:hypothetical protein SK875_A02261 [Burkholderia contaminans]VWC33031.1 hypothetical protein BCO23253_06604 [Burkholderia contaminans]
MLAPQHPSRRLTRRSAHVLPLAHRSNRFTRLLPHRVADCSTNRFSLDMLQHRLRDPAFSNVRRERRFLQCRGGSRLRRSDNERRTLRRRKRRPDSKPSSPQPLTLDFRRRCRVRPALTSRLQRHTIQRREQLSQRHVQRVTDVRQCLDRRIGDPAFDRRNVGPIDMRLESERFLRFFDRMSTRLDPFAQGNRDRGRPRCRRG